MDIVQKQGSDEKESIAKMNTPTPPRQINVPRLKLAKEKNDGRVKAEEMQENTKEEEDRTVGIVQQGKEYGKKEDSSIKDVQEEEEEECTTPKGVENRIPEPLVCPPPPARRSAQSTKRTTHIPAERFFPVPEDLNSVFIPRKKIRSL